jgi:hypothetical protein
MKLNGSSNPSRELSAAQPKSAASSRSKPRALATHFVLRIVSTPQETGLTWREVIDKKEDKSEKNL